MIKGRGGMGSHKHGISGKIGKNPKLRLEMKMEAEKNEIKAKKFNCKFGSIKELMKGI